MTSEFVTSADGTRIAYRRLGDGPPLLIVHGGLGTSTGWAAVAERLARDFEVVLFDRRGRGAREAGGEPHTLEHEIDDVRALLDRAGTGTALVGHSFGGAVALEAARQDARVSAVVLNEPVPGLVLLGTTSPLAQRENCKRLAATLPRGRLELLEGLGHVAHAAAPELVAATVRAFLSSSTKR